MIPTIHLTIKLENVTQPSQLQAMLASALRDFDQQMWLDYGSAAARKKGGKVFPVSDTFSISVSLDTKES